MQPRLSRLQIRNDIVPRWRPQEAAPRKKQSGMAGFLFQVLVCTAPSAALLAMGHANQSGHWFWGMLGLMLIRPILTGRKDEMICLLLATAPFINLLREAAFYNVIVVLYGGAFTYYVLFGSGAMWTMVRRFPLIACIFAYVFFYYAVSLYNTQQYSVNIRLFELAFAIAFVLLLERKPALLGKALVGLILSACLIGICMLPIFQGANVSRLGMIQVEGGVLGNPTQLGVPLAFGFLALVIDQGRWLGLRSNVFFRLLLLLMVVPLLALTTSRAAWLVAVMGLAVSFVLGSRQRMKILAGGVVVLVAFVGIMLSPLRPSLEKGLNRTFSDTRSIRQKTSGRSDQWKVAYYAFSRTPRTILQGYGPGMGPLVYQKYSLEVPGVRYAIGRKVALHSLFMQIGVEAGVLGLGLLGFGLATVFVRIIQNHTGMVLPLVCFLGYVIVVITVSGNDINSGVLFGMAILGTMKVITPKPPPTPEAEDPGPVDYSAVERF